jgi:cytochrome c553
MSPVAKTLSAQDVQALAEYFSSQRPMSSSYNGDSTKIAQGKTIAADSQCTMCHLGGFSGKTEIPVAAGQPVPIHRQQLRFRDGRRTTTPAR